MTSVAQRMNASREARKRQGGMTRTYSPLTPIIQRLYSKSDEVSQLHSLLHSISCPGAHKF